MATFKDLCLDANDSRRVAPFWAPALGLSLEYQDQGDAVLRGSEPGQTLWINTVPEAKTVKNRMHWDVTGDVADFEARGATRLWEMPRWTVLADPEGNEFCVFPED